MNFLSLIGRNSELFNDDLIMLEDKISHLVSNSKFLIVGGAGSIGQSVVLQIFKRNPRVLHVVDISENNLVELVRNIRSSLGYCSGEFKTFVIDCGSIEFDSLISQNCGYDYIFNLSALKHVRNEEDPYTLMRMIMVNIFNTIKSAKVAKKVQSKNFFCVSTDKAANPVNMMGASKKIMELFLMRESDKQKISMARFANVAFSDGSLLHGFNQRFLKKQPISAPSDVKRYFLTPQESGELCLLSGLFGDNRDIFFPKLLGGLKLTTFSDIAKRYLSYNGFQPVECQSEDEARFIAKDLIPKKKWPCFFFKSDTTGEKDFEEFFTNNEIIDNSRLKTIGIIKNEMISYNSKLDQFEENIYRLRSKGNWKKSELVDAFLEILPSFEHKETGKYLDQRM